MARAPTPIVNPVEVELRDKISAGIKEIAKNLKDLRLEAAQSGIGSSDSFARFGHETKTFQTIIVDATDKVEAMGGRVSGLAKSIVGVSGAAGAIVLLARNLDDFATNRVRLSAFSRDTGLMTTEILRMEQAGRRMGYSTEESRGFISNMVGQLRTFYATGRDLERSELYQGLVKMGPEGAKAAKNLYALADAGKWNEAIHFLVNYYRAQSTQGQIYLSDHVLHGIPPDFILNLQEYESHVKYLYDGGVEQSKEYLENLENIRGKVEEEWGLIATHAIGKINEIFKAMENTGSEHGFSDWVNAQFDGVIKGISDVHKEFEWWQNFLLGTSAFDTAKSPVTFGPAFTATPGGLPQQQAAQAAPSYLTPEQAYGVEVRHFQAGTARVQKTGLAVVHEGEEIIAARDAIRAVPSDKQMFDALGGVRGIIGGLLGSPSNPTMATIDYFPEKHWAPGSKPKLWSPEWGDRIIDWLGVSHEYQQQEAGLESPEGIQFAESKKDSKQKLDEVRDVLQRMEQKNINLASFQYGGDVSDTGPAKLHEGEVVLPRGIQVKHTGPQMVRRGEQVVPRSVANQLGFIGAIGATETDFSRKQAYSEAYNQPSGRGLNRNIRAHPGEAATYSDYGFFQMNAGDVKDAIKRGMDPETARHLRGGGPGGKSTLGEQVAAVHEYMTLKYGKLYENVAGGSRESFEALRKKAGEQWHGLRDKPGKAWETFRMGTTAITAAQASEARDMIDETTPARPSGAIDFAFTANDVPPGVRVTPSVEGPLFEDGQFSVQQSKQLPAMVQ